MTADLIRLNRDARPFRPFILKLVDGTLYSIRHPDYVSIPPARAREIMIYQDDDSEGGFSTRWVNLGLVMELIVSGQPTQAATPGGDNGT
jgi:hypothetical protein